jgi:hypothetical protein
MNGCLIRSRPHLPFLQRGAVSLLFLSHSWAPRLDRLRRASSSCSGNDSNKFSFIYICGTFPSSCPLPCIGKNTFQSGSGSPRQNLGPAQSAGFCNSLCYPSPGVLTWGPGPLRGFVGNSLLLSSFPFSFSAIHLSSLAFFFFFKMKQCHAL